MNKAIEIFIDWKKRKNAFKCIYNRIQQRMTKNKSTPPEPFFVYAVYLIVIYILYVSG